MDAATQCTLLQWLEASAGNNVSSLPGIESQMPALLASLCGGGGLVADDPQSQLALAPASTSPSLHSTWRMVEGVREREYGLRIVAFLIRRSDDEDEEEVAVVGGGGGGGGGPPTVTPQSLLRALVGGGLVHRLYTLLEGLRKTGERRVVDVVRRVMLLEVLHCLFSSDTLEAATPPQQHWALYRQGVERYRKGEWEPLTLESLERTLNCRSLAHLLHRRTRSLATLTLLAGLRLEQVYKAPRWEDLCSSSSSSSSSSGGVGSEALASLPPHPFFGKGVGEGRGLAAEEVGSVLIFNAPLPGFSGVAAPLPPLITTAAATLLLLFEARVEACMEAVDYLKGGDNDVPLEVREGGGGEGWLLWRAFRVRLREELTNPTLDPLEWEEGEEDDEYEGGGGVAPLPNPPPPPPKAASSPAFYTPPLAHLAECLRDVFALPISTPMAFNTFHGFHPLDTLPVGTLQRELLGVRASVTSALRASGASLPPFPPPHITHSTPLPLRGGLDAQWEEGSGGGGGGVGGGVSEVDVLACALGERRRGGGAGEAAGMDAETHLREVEREEEEEDDFFGTQASLLPPPRTLTHRAYLSALIGARCAVDLPPFPPPFSLIHPPSPTSSLPPPCDVSAAIDVLELTMDSPLRCTELWQWMASGEEPLAALLRSARSAWPADPSLLSRALGAVSKGAYACRAALAYFHHSVPTLTLPLLGGPTFFVGEMDSWAAPSINGRRLAGEGEAVASTPLHFRAQCSLHRQDTTAPALAAMGVFVSRGEERRAGEVAARECENAPGGRDLTPEEEEVMFKSRALGGDLLLRPHHCLFLGEVPAGGFKPYQTFSLPAPLHNPCFFGGPTPSSSPSYSSYSSSASTVAAAAATAASPMSTGVAVPGAPPSLLPSMDPTILLVSNGLHAVVGFPNGAIPTFATPRHVLFNTFSHTAAMVASLHASFPTFLPHVKGALRRGDRLRTFIGECESQRGSGVGGTSPLNLFSAYTFLKKALGFAKSCASLEALVWSCPPTTTTNNNSSSSSEGGAAHMTPFAVASTAIELLQVVLPLLLVAHVGRGREESTSVSASSLSFSLESGGVLDEFASLHSLLSSTATQLLHLLVVLAEGFTADTLPALLSPRTPPLFAQASVASGGVGGGGGNEPLPFLHMMIQWVLSEEGGLEGTPDTLGPFTLATLRIMRVCASGILASRASPSASLLAFIAARTPRHEKCGHCAVDPSHCTFLHLGGILADFYGLFSAGGGKGDGGAAPRARLCPLALPSLEELRGLALHSYSSAVSPGMESILRAAAAAASGSGGGGGGGGGGGVSNPPPPPFLPFLLQTIAREVEEGLGLGLSAAGASFGGAGASPTTLSPTHFLLRAQLLQLCGIEGSVREWEERVLIHSLFLTSTRLLEWTAPCEDVFLVSDPFRGPSSSTPTPPPPPHLISPHRTLIHTLACSTLHTLLSSSSSSSSSSATSTTTSGGVGLGLRGVLLSRLLDPASPSSALTSLVRCALQLPYLTLGCVGGVTPISALATTSTTTTTPDFWVPRVAPDALNFPALTSRVPSKWGRMLASGSMEALRVVRDIFLGVECGEGGGKWDDTVGGLLLRLPITTSSHGLVARGVWEKGEKGEKEAEKFSSLLPFPALLSLALFTATTTTPADLSSGAGSYGALTSIHPSLSTVTSLSLSLLPLVTRMACRRAALAAQQQQQQLLTASGGLGALSAASSSLYLRASTSLNTSLLLHTQLPLVLNGSLVKTLLPPGTTTPTSYTQLRQISLCYAMELACATLQHGTQKDLVEALGGWSGLIKEALGVVRVKPPSHPRLILTSLAMLNSLVKEGYRSLIATTTGPQDMVEFFACLLPCDVPSPVLDASNPSSSSPPSLSDTVGGVSVGVMPRIQAAALNLLASLRGPYPTHCPPLRLNDILSTLVVDARSHARDLAALKCALLEVGYALPAGATGAGTGAGGGGGEASSPALTSLTPTYLAGCWGMCDAWVSLAPHALACFVAEGSQQQHLQLPTNSPPHHACLDLEALEGGVLPGYLPHLLPPHHTPAYHLFKGRVVALLLAHKAQASTLYFAAQGELIHSLHPFLTLPNLKSLLPLLPTLCQRVCEDGEVAVPIAHSFASAARVLLQEEEEAEEGEGGEGRYALLYDLKAMGLEYGVAAYEVLGAAAVTPSTILLQAKLLDVCAACVGGGSGGGGDEYTLGKERGLILRLSELSFDAMLPWVKGQQQQQQQQQDSRPHTAVLYESGANALGVIVATFGTPPLSDLPKLLLHSLKESGQWLVGTWGEHSMQWLNALEGAVSASETEVANKNASLRYFPPSSSSTTTFSSTSSTSASGGLFGRKGAMGNTSTTSGSSYSSSSSSSSTANPSLPVYSPQVQALVSSTLLNSSIHPPPPNWRAVGEPWERVHRASLSLALEITSDKKGPGFEALLGTEAWFTSVLVASPLLAHANTIALAHMAVAQSAQNSNVGAAASSTTPSPNSHSSSTLGADGAYRLPHVTPHSGAPNFLNPALPPPPSGSLVATLVGLSHRLSALECSPNLVFAATGWGFGGSHHKGFTLREVGGGGEGERRGGRSTTAVPVPYLEVDFSHISPPPVSPLTFTSRYFQWSDPSHVSLILTLRLLARSLERLTDLRQTAREQRVLQESMLNNYGGGSRMGRGGFTATTTTTTTINGSRVRFEGWEWEGVEGALLSLPSTTLAPLLTTALTHRRYTTASASEAGAALSVSTALAANARERVGWGWGSAGDLVQAPLDPGEAPQSWCFRAPTLAAYMVRDVGVLLDQWGREEEGGGGGGSAPSNGNGSGGGSGGVVGGGMLHTLHTTYTLSFSTSPFSRESQSLQMLSDRGDECKRMEVKGFTQGFLQGLLSSALFTLNAHKELREAMEGQERDNTTLSIPLDEEEVTRSSHFPHSLTLAVASFTGGVEGGSTAAAAAAVAAGERGARDAREVSVSPLLPPREDAFSFNFLPRKSVEQGVQAALTFARACASDAPYLRERIRRGIGCWGGGVNLVEALTPFTFIEHCANCCSTLPSPGTTGPSYAPSYPYTSYPAQNPTFPHPAAASPTSASSSSSSSATRLHCPYCFALPTRAAYCTSQCMGLHWTKGGHGMNCKGLQTSASFSSASSFSSGGGGGSRYGGGMEGGSVEFDILTSSFSSSTLPTSPVSTNGAYLGGGGGGSGGGASDPEFHPWGGATAFSLECTPRLGHLLLAMDMLSRGLCEEVGVEKIVARGAGGGGDGSGVGVGGGGSSGVADGEDGGALHTSEENKAYLTALGLSREVGFHEETLALGMDASALLQCSVVDTLAEGAAPLDFYTLLELLRAVVWRVGDGGVMEAWVREVREPLVRQDRRERSSSTASSSVSPLAKSFGFGLGGGGGSAASIGGGGGGGGPRSSPLFSVASVRRHSVVSVGHFPAASFHSQQHMHYQNLQQQQQWQGAHSQGGGRPSGALQTLTKATIRLSAHLGEMYLTPHTPPSHGGRGAGGQAIPHTLLHSSLSPPPPTRTVEECFRVIRDAIGRVWGAGDRVKRGLRGGGRVNTISDTSGGSGGGVWGGREERGRALFAKLQPLLEGLVVRILQGVLSMEEESRSKRWDFSLPLRRAAGGGGGGGGGEAAYTPTNNNTAVTTAPHNPMVYLGSNTLEFVLGGGGEWRKGCEEAYLDECRGKGAGGEGGAPLPLVKSLAYYLHKGDGEVVW